VREGFYTTNRARLTEVAPDVDFVPFGDRDDMLSKLPRAHALYGGSPREDVLESCDLLRWVHMSSAGVDRYYSRELAARGVTLTRGSGAYGVPISEHVLAMMLAFTRGLPQYIRQQTRREWHRTATISEISGKVLGVYGMGDIGSDLARKAHALGMRVYGLARRDREAPPYVEALWTPDRLDDLLAASDFLAACAPLTNATRGRFGAREFAVMKDTAYFFNIGRGAVAVQADLEAALSAGEIAGAGLDVTDPEPLPEDSPLWDMENVILTPHVSGGSDGTPDRVTEIVLENVRRFAAGEPLLNVVDPEHGY
jgi:phosphoglycerate dehydrogenase-like enzyme